MTLEQAARDLHDELRANPDVVAVGIGRIDADDAIFVYVSSGRSAAALRPLAEGWQGYRVEVRRTGRVRAGGISGSAAVAR